jgi:hypothetical protein
MTNNNSGFRQNFGFDCSDKENVSVEFSQSRLMSRFPELRNGTTMSAKTHSCWRAVTLWLIGFLRGAHITDVTVKE